jgi:hypothetical protein
MILPDGASRSNLFRGVQGGLAQVVIEKTSVFFHPKRRMVPSWRRFRVALEPTGGEMQGP